MTEQLPLFSRVSRAKNITQNRDGHLALWQCFDLIHKELLDHLPEREEVYDHEICRALVEVIAEFGRCGLIDETAWGVHYNLCLITAQCDDWLHSPSSWDGRQPTFMFWREGHPIIWQGDALVQKITRLLVREIPVEIP